MNSIGVDFKLKSMELEGKNIKLQIVRIINRSGILLVKKGLEPSLRAIIAEPRRLLLSMTLLIRTRFSMLRTGWLTLTSFFKFNQDSLKRMC